MRILPARCREQLQPRDFEFIAATLAGGEAGAENLASLFEDPGSLAAILDHERGHVPRGMTQLAAAPSGAAKSSR